MGRRPPALLAVIVLLVVAAAAAGSAHVLEGLGDPGEPEAPAPGPMTLSSGADGGAAVVLAAGDIAECGSDGDEATARLLDRMGGTIAALGDLAYDEGTAEEFAECYGPSWGRHRDRTRPAIGNHDVETDDGGPYYDYFGRLAGPAGRGWYSFDLSTRWHAIVLNSNCDEAGGCDPGSPQHDWLVADLRAHAHQHVVAWMHHARFSSGQHGSDEDMQPFFAALADHGADLLLTAHDHLYERFAPMNATGRRSPGGVMVFVVGTGGRSHYDIEDRERNSQVVDNEHYGVLRLVLRPNGYRWRFVPVDRGVTVDAGTRSLSPPAR